MLKLRFDWWVLLEQTCNEQFAQLTLINQKRINEPTCLTPPAKEYSFLGYFRKPLQERNERFAVQTHSLWDSQFGIMPSETSSLDSFYLELSLIQRERIKNVSISLNFVVVYMLTITAILGFPRWSIAHDSCQASTQASRSAWAFAFSNSYVCVFVCMQRYLPRI